jgi:hypothetical protein
MLPSRGNENGVFAFCDLSSITQKWRANKVYSTRLGDGSILSQGALAMSTAVPVFYRCIPRFVTHDLDLHPYARLLFVLIAEETYLDTGRVQMTIDYLAKISGLSERTVLRYLPQLEEKGYVQILRAPLGSKIPNTYQLIGLAAEIVIRKSRGETTPATPARPLWQQPAGKGESHPQMTERQMSILNRPYPGKIVTEECRSDTLQASDSILAAQTDAVVSPEPPLPANETIQSADNRPTDSPQVTENRQDNAPNTPSVAAETVAPVSGSSQPMSESQTTKQQKEQTNQAIEENVVDDDSADFFELKGMAPELMQSLIKRYGKLRVWIVLQAVERQKHVLNKPGWVVTALEENWQFGHAAHKNRETDPNRYLSGRYAEFIHR